MTTIDAFIGLLIDALAKTIPPDPSHPAANLSIARELLEALRPTDPLEAALGVIAIAAHFAAMDSFARAAKPGVADNMAVRLRSSALAASRLADRVLQSRPQPSQPAPYERRAPAPYSVTNVVMPPSSVRHRAQLPPTFPGLLDPMTRDARRSGWRNQAVPLG
jgi:hypothetical protein